MYQGVEAYPRWGPASLLIHTASLKRALGRFARQIAIPKTVKDFHQTCGYFCGKLASMEVG
jgi:hypothetical protein